MLQSGASVHVTVLAHVRENPVHFMQGKCELDFQSLRLIEGAGRAPGGVISSMCFGGLPLSGIAGYAYILTDIYNSIDNDTASKLKLEDFNPLQMTTILSMNRATGFAQMVQIMSDRAKLL